MSVDFAAAQWRGSPNFGQRRDGLSPEIILLHYTGMSSGMAAEDWLCDPQSGVSAHYIVHEDGRVVQMVREVERAWHAGVGWWMGRGDVNSRSIGIEIVNEGHDGGLPAFASPQIAATIDLCHDIATRHAIRPERVLAHSDVAPGRKRDPGERFPWADLATAGVGHYVEPVATAGGDALAEGASGSEVEDFQRMLAAYGYAVPSHGVFDAATARVVEAFQRHFRPARIDGIADRSTRQTLVSLLQALTPEAP